MRHGIGSPLLSQLQIAFEKAICKSTRTADKFRRVLTYTFSPRASQSLRTEKSRTSLGLSLISSRCSSFTKDIHQVPTSTLRSSATRKTVKREGKMGSIPEVGRFFYSKKIGVSPYSSSVKWEERPSFPSSFSFASSSFSVFHFHRCHLRQKTNHRWWNHPWILRSRIPCKTEKKHTKKNVFIFHRQVHCKEKCNFPLVFQFPSLSDSCARHEARHPT